MSIYALDEKRPQLGARTWIADNAVVVGDVTLGDDVSVWYGCTIRGDVFPIRIGARTNVQDHTMIHVTNNKAATTIGEDVTIGHMVMLHGCTIGDRVLVGMGSIVLDDAVIESDAMLGAGSLLPPGGRVPSGMLALGRPAKVVRPLRDEDRARIAEATQNYLQYANMFANGLRKIG